MFQLQWILVVILVFSAYASAKKHKHNGEQEMWIASIEHGNSAFHPNSSEYKVYRNVLDFGCVGDGIVDDTDCFNKAISFGNRCGDFCGSSTTVPALVYVPSGKYRISSPIQMMYFTQLVGNVNDPPTLVASPNFAGLGLLDANPYNDAGQNWYTNQNNFFRQVRNFVIDLTPTPATAPTTGIHWQVAQATSLVNIHFIMTPNSEHQGIWMENGSGGFMSDLVFEGGKFGMWVGNQQFLSRNLKFHGCTTAIFMNWNWQWTFKNIEINNCGIGIDMSQIGQVKPSAIGSILVLDSIIADTIVGVKTYANPAPSVPDTSATLLLDNVRVHNVGTTIVDINNALVLPGGTMTIASWGRGSFYDSENGTGIFRQDYLSPPFKAPTLLNDRGQFFEKSRPQYGNVPLTDFINVQDFGVLGDGLTDVSEALQEIINSNIGKIIFLPHGAYILESTVHIPSGTRLIGELWSLLMAGGNSYFKDSANPKPMLRIGVVGEVGSVEITDLMFSTLGSQPGAILVEWNIHGFASGAAGLWDSHFRVGGFAGSNLQYEQCPRGQGSVPECEAAFMLLHVTKSGSGYFENVWAWTADHDLDDGLAQRQISIYTGRGVLVESENGPNWFYGTQSEHNVFYQYQLSTTANVFMTMIQSETPYWQPAPVAPLPFAPNPIYGDPTYYHCSQSSTTCKLSYAAQITDSSNVYIYGAGLYNFFNNYDQICLNTEDCQDNMVTLENNADIYLYNLNTKAAKNMVVKGNAIVLARQADNSNGFCSTINAFFG